MSLTTQAPAWRAYTECYVTVGDRVLDLLLKDRGGILVVVLKWGLLFVNLRKGRPYVS